MTVPNCACGATYESFRTGLTYAKVRSMLLAGPDADFWRPKHKSAVMRLWSELKRAQWDQTHGYCASVLAANDPQPLNIPDLRGRIMSLVSQIETSLGM